ncbi:LexA family transcriptional regulator [Leucobacter sp. cx-169]|uniref:LexA family protein n=1 Tax=Leucobacter sp. cx-169 TaxID=2770549 RepID=UPI00165E42F3|nr:translesion error-prone DNA polymerase V autoproteolytic subunit [Leucobacter sp. cx-169]MBC9927244.1 translesion error-prone DNA polymerase V autoproteolytic subunit [Leucobacter sp. cx-169]
MPAASEAVQAGFPSPAQDYFDGDLDLGELLMPSRVSSYVVTAAGDSMIRAGIFDGDKLIIDRAINAISGHVVIAVLDGELTVKRLSIDAGGQVVLRAENPLYPDIQIHGLADLTVWGVVTWVLHRPSRV